ncbi:Aerobic glycerol-3-phosphate dehydrogenase [compost metagenome]
MAENVVDKVIELLGAEGGRAKYGGSVTKGLPISGGELGGSEGFETFVAKQTKEGVRFGFRQEEAAFLARRYGSNVEHVFARAAAAAELTERYKLPLALAVQLLYAIEEEMAVKPVDFLIRRTGDLFFRIADVQQWKSAVIAAMADRLGWSSEQRTEYARELERKLEEAVEPGQV